MRRWNSLLGSVPWSLLYDCKAMKNGKRQRFIWRRRWERTNHVFLFLILLFLSSWMMRDWFGESSDDDDDQDSSTNSAAMGGTTSKHLGRRKRRIKKTLNSSASCNEFSPMKLLDGISGSLTPVIGILSVPPRKKPLAGNSFYIASSYVKWLEGAGARTIAIPYDATPDMMDEILEQIHLLFLPGGDAPLPPSLIYLLDKIKRHNLDGSYFPVWGTCLGFQFLIQYIAGTETIMEQGFNSSNVSWPLEQVVPQELYADPQIYNIITQTSPTFNSHSNGTSPQNFRDNPLLHQSFVITSINHDFNGRPFVSSMEPRQDGRSSVLPFYGVQYHPERNAFEYQMNPDDPTLPLHAIDHSPTGIAFSFHISNFVVQLARKSLAINHPKHQYTLWKKYPPLYTYSQIPGQKTFQLIHLIPRSARTNKNGTLLKSDSFKNN